MLRRRLSKQSRAGAVLVEFSLVLPIIFLFFAAMIEISRVLLLQHTADTAAYEGARHAMVPGANTDEAKQVAQQLLDIARLQGTTVTVSPALITEETPIITVGVAIPTAANSWIFPFWFKQAQVTSVVSLYCERPPMIKLTGIPEMESKVKEAKSQSSGKGGKSTPAL